MFACMNHCTIKLNCYENVVMNQHERTECDFYGFFRIIKKDYARATIAMQVPYFTLSPFRSVIQNHVCKWA